MKTEYQLNALNQFRCLGGECPQTCCQTWSIVVDPPTLNKWKKLKESGEVDLITDKLVEIEVDGKLQQTLKLNDENYCPSMDRDGLCSIHKQYGPKYIPDVCKSYPRFSKENRFRKVSSLGLSCPEVVTQSVFNSQLEFRKKKPARNISRAKLDAFENFAMDLDDAVHKILDVKDVELAVRVFLIADVLVRSYEAINNGVSDANYFASLFDVTQAEVRKRALEIPDIEIDEVTAGSVWYNFFHYYLGREYQVKSFDYNQSDFVKNYPKEIKDNHGFKQFFVMVQDYMQSSQGFVREQYSENFTRYLRIAFINKGFAWQPFLGEFIASFLSVIMPFCIIQMLLWIKYRETGELSEEFVTEVIFTVERMVDHSNEMALALTADQHMLQLHRYHSSFLQSF